MLRITGGKVYDPANGVDGVVRDVCIADGRIVDSIDGGSGGGKTSAAHREAAAGMIVFPTSADQIVDVHTHVAGGAINFARAMTPEDHRRTTAFIRSSTTRRPA